MMIAKQMSKEPGAKNCAHGGPAYCNKGCYAGGGEVEKEPMREDSSEIMSDEALQYEQKEEEPMKMAKGGMMHPKHMAKMIMASKPKMMAKGGMIEAEDEETPVASHEDGLDMEDNESMPLDHASESDERFTSEEASEDPNQFDWEDEEMQPKKDLLSRVMMKISSRKR